MYDSAADTLKHIKRVNEMLLYSCVELQKRAILHDTTKLESPEKEILDVFTPRLKGSTYGSDEYKGFLESMKVALDHHYEHNSHHPEYYYGGINDMDLFDLLEMLIDWKAASERHENENIMKSIEINRKRFNISDQLVSILNVTAQRHLVKYE